MKLKHTRSVILFFIYEIFVRSFYELQLQKK
jgi:hypothetical protein